VRRDGSRRRRSASSPVGAVGPCTRRRCACASKAFTESCRPRRDRQRSSSAAPASTSSTARGLGGSRLVWDALGRRRDRRPTPEVHGHARRRDPARGLRTPRRGAGHGALAAHGRRRVRSPRLQQHLRHRPRTPPAREPLGVARLSDLARATPSCGSAQQRVHRAAATAGPACETATGLPQTHLQGLDHDLAYRALVSGAVDRHRRLHRPTPRTQALRPRRPRRRSGVLRALRRRLALSPRRRDARRARPRSRPLRRLSGRFDEARMAGPQRRAPSSITRRRPPSPPSSCATRSARPGPPPRRLGRRPARLAARIVEHLELVGVSLLAAILPRPADWGVLAARPAAASASRARRGRRRPDADRRWRCWSS